MKLIIGKHGEEGGCGLWGVHIDWRTDHFTVTCSVTKFMFRCEANNPVQGMGTSNDTVLTFEGEVNYFKSGSRAISYKLKCDELGVITRKGDEDSQEK